MWTKRITDPAVGLQAARRDRLGGARRSAVLRELLCLAEPKRRVGADATRIHTLQLQQVGGRVGTLLRQVELDDSDPRMSAQPSISIITSG